MPSDAHMDSGQWNYAMYQPNTAVHMAHLATNLGLSGCNRAERSKVQCMGHCLWMCVSTGNVGTRNAMASTTEAVLWPTPAGVPAQQKLLGTSPPCRSTSIWQGGFRVREYLIGKEARPWTIACLTKTHSPGENRGGALAAVHAVWRLHMSGQRLTSAGAQSMRRPRIARARTWLMALRLRALVGASPTVRMCASITPTCVPDSRSLASRQHASGWLACWGSRGLPPCAGHATA